MLIGGLNLSREVRHVDSLLKEMGLYHHIQQKKSLLSFYKQHKWSAKSARVGSAEAW
jgi:hypothetical protein